MTLFVIATLLLSGIGYQYRAGIALTPPEKDYPIKIKSISIDGVKDDNVSKQMINFAIGNLKSEKEAIFEVELEGDLSLISHMRILYGRNNNSSLINSDEILVHRFDIDCANQNCATIKISVVIPNSTKGCWIKFWPIIVSKDAKIIGGANTRPWSLCNHFYTPQISTSEATDITYQGATLNGDMWNVGNAPPNYVWFAIREDGEKYDPNQMLGFVQFERRDSFSYQIEEGLLPNQLYYFKAIAGNVAGIVYASERSFKTLPAPPKVETLPATEVNMKEWVSSWEEVNAKLNLEVTEHGNADYLDIGWYWYDKHEKPQIIHKTEPVRVFGPFETGQKIPLSHQMYVPDGTSTYIFIAYVINNVGVESTGDSLYFPPPYPEIPLKIETSGKKDDHQWNQVTLYADLKTMGIKGPCEIWFDYCEADNYVQPLPTAKWQESTHLIVDRAGVYSITITDLPSDRGIGPWPKYVLGEAPKEVIEAGVLQNVPGWVYVAHAKNSFGQEAVDTPEKCESCGIRHYYGFGTRFHPGLPVIRPLEVTNISCTYVDLNVSLLWPGFSTAVTYWVEYSGNGKAYKKSMEITKEVPLAEYSTLRSGWYVNPKPDLTIHLEGLEPATIYTVKFYASNDDISTGSNRRVYESKQLVKFMTKFGKKDTEYTGPIIQTVGYKEVYPGDIILQGKLINAGKSDWIKVWMEFYVITTSTNGFVRTIEGRQSVEELGTLQNTPDLGYPSFEVSKFGLATNQTVSFRFVAENNAGQRGYGETIQFTTSPSVGQAVKPKLTLKIIQITPTTLVVDGYLDSIGKNVDGKNNSLDVWFEAGRIVGPYEGHMITEFKSQIFKDINTPTRVSWYLTGLEPGVKYGVQVYGSDRSVWTVGDGMYWKEFDTPIIPPEFRANKADFITRSKALLNADVTYLSSTGNCNFYIEWGKAKHGELGGCDFENKMPWVKYRTEGSIIGDTIPKGFSWEANDLEPDTYYVFRVIAEPINRWGNRPEGSKGLYPSNERVFKTEK